VERHKQRSAALWLRDASVPLVITLVGGLLTAYLLPRALERSENHRKALELQTALASQMGQSIASAMSTAQLIARGVLPKENVNGQSAFDTGLHDWKSQSVAIGTQLDAYFSRRSNEHGSLSDEWNAYSAIVEDAFFLSGTGLKRDRCSRTQDVKDFILRTNRSRDLSCWAADRTEGWRASECRLAGSSPPWNALAACDGDSLRQYSYVRGDAYRQAYISVTDQLLGRGRALIRQMLLLTPAGF
jgi:hypothetical protein